jgi:hypothetical protein
MDISSPEWVVPSGNWSITDETSYNGSSCLKLSNVGVPVDTKHFIESKTFDLSDSTKAYFSFKYAFAKRSNDNSDYLKVLASNDCGKTWSVRKMIHHTQLTTAANQISFLPSFDEWKEATISSILGPYCVENFRFKFEFKSGGGNDLYIDNINISYENTTSIKATRSNDISIYPNPSSNLLNVTSSNTINHVKLYDITGKLVFTKGYLSKEKILLDISYLNKGFYQVLVIDSKGEQTLPFIKN